MLILPGIKLQVAKVQLNVPRNGDVDVVTYLIF